MISDGKIAYDGSFDGLRTITGNLTRFTITMEGDCPLHLTGSNLLSFENGVFEYEADLEKTPVKSLLSQLSQTEGIKDVEIKKAPIEQVIAELYKSWKNK